MHIHRSSNTLKLLLTITSEVSLSSFNIDDMME